MKEGSISGLWQGVYSYPKEPMPVFFKAWLDEMHGSIEGDVEEAEKGRMGEPLALRATVSGMRAGDHVRFTKTYDGSGGWFHAVDYDGVLSADLMEISGTWTVPGSWSGTFLMMRAQGTDESVVREAFETM